MPVIDGAIRIVATVASVLVALGFVLFAVDQLSGASARQQAAISDSAVQSEPTRDGRHSGLRDVVDDIDAALLSPFAGVAPSSNAWVARGVPTLLALLLYGVGLGFLARWIRSRA